MPPVATTDLPSLRAPPLPWPRPAPEDGAAAEEHFNAVVPPRFFLGLACGFALSVPFWIGLAATLLLLL